MKRTRKLRTLALLLLIPFLGFAQPSPKSQQIIEDLKGGVVLVDAHFGAEKEFGTGILVDWGTDKVRMLTAHHILKNSDGSPAPPDSIRVSFYKTETPVRARVAQAWPKKDLVVLICDRSAIPSGFRPAIANFPWDNPDNLDLNAAVSWIGQGQRNWRQMTRKNEVLENSPDAAIFKIDVNSIGAGESGGPVFSDTFHLAGLLLRQDQTFATVYKITHAIDLLEVFNVPHNYLQQWPLFEPGKANLLLESYDRATLALVQSRPADSLIFDLRPYQIIRPGIPPGKYDFEAHASNSSTTLGDRLHLRPGRTRKILAPFGKDPQRDYKWPTYDWKRTMFPSVNLVWRINQIDEGAIAPLGFDFRIHRLYKILGVGYTYFGVPEQENVRVRHHRIMTSWALPAYDYFLERHPLLNFHFVWGFGIWDREESQQGLVPVTGEIPDDPLAGSAPHAVGWIFGLGYMVPYFQVELGVVGGMASATEPGQRVAPEAYLKVGMNLPVHFGLKRHLYPVVQTKLSVLKEEKR